MSSAMKLEAVTGVGEVRRRSFTNAEAMSRGAFVREAATSSQRRSTSNPRQVSNTACENKSQ